MLSETAKRVARYVEGRLVPSADVARVCGLSADELGRVLRELEGAMRPGWTLVRTRVRPYRHRKFEAAIGVMRDAFTVKRKVARQAELPGLVVEGPPNTPARRRRPSSKRRLTKRQQALRDMVSRG